MISFRAVIIKKLAYLFKLISFESDWLLKLKNYLSEFILRLIPLPWGVRVKAEMIAGVPCSRIRRKNNKGKLIIYIHGGGFVYDSPRTYEHFCGGLAKDSVQDVLLIHYPLAPKHPYPAAVNDCLKVVEHSQKVTKYSGQQLTLGGDSAGANLVLATLVMMNKSKLELPGKIFLLSGWFDLSPAGSAFSTHMEIKDPILKQSFLKRWATMYAPEMNKSNALISPLYADLSYLPPTLIHAGSDDILINDSRNLYSALKRESSAVLYREWSGMFHCWHLFGGIIPEGRQAIEEIIRFID